MKFYSLVLLQSLWLTTVCVPADLPGQDPVRQLEADAFQNRMKVFCDLWAAYLDDELDFSQQQRERLDEILKNALDKFDWAKFDTSKIGGHQQFHQRQLNCFPSNFTFTGGPVQQMSQRIDSDLQSILNESQKAKLTSLLVDRKEKFSSACLGEILNMIDYELYLSAEQRVGVRELLERKDQRFQDAYFSFRERNGQFQASKRLNLDRVVAAGILSDAQTQRVHDLQDPHFTFVFHRNSQTLPEFIERQRIALESAMQVRMEYLLTSSLLNSEKARHLDLATFGVASRMLKRPYLNSMLLVENENGDSYGGVIFPRTFQIEREPLWKAIVTSDPKTEKVLKQRKLLRDQDTVSYITAILDNELLLSKAQNRRLNELAMNALNAVNWESGIDYGKYRHYGMSDEVQMRAMCIVMIGVGDQDVQQLFNASQMSAWRLLKSYFTEEENRLFISSSFDLRVHLGWLSRTPEDEIKEPPL